MILRKERMKMKIYKVFVAPDVRESWRGNWWDEYLGHVVVADNESEALEIAFKTGLMVPKEIATVEEIDTNKKGIVLSDFNAG